MTDNSDPFHAANIAYDAGQNDGYMAGYAAAMEDGLDASREAVSAALSHEDHCKGQIRKICNCSRFDALAAIDALRKP